jgi:hypothetical protein
MKTKTTSLPAPIGGLNDRDSIADMPMGDAVVLENWWPYPSYLGVRKGSSDHVTGFAAGVETLVEYLPTSGASKLFAAAGTAIYDVTTAGAVGAAVQTGLTNARWQDSAITTPGGSFLYLVNGADKPRLWDGASWVAVDGASTPAITGVTTTDLIHVCLFKNRLFFVEKNSMSVWYLPVNSIGGAAAEIDLGSIFRLGGSIMACYTWTIDAGNGADDHFVILSTNGEVAVYRGTDPSSAADWSIVGVFVLGRPIGRRCAVKYGGDLAINCMEGVYPLGKGLLSASVDRRIALTDKIQNSVSIAANGYETSFGWQVALYPAANMLLLNVPIGSGVNFQYAQNTITGAWAKFTGWDANVWLNASSGLYFGDDTTVKKAWTGNLDGTTPIVADVCGAFSFYSNRSSNKYWTMVRPYIQTTGTPSILYALNTDFALSDPNGVLITTPFTGMTWGSMTWGSMTWGGGLTPTAKWNTVGAVANSAAIRLKVQNNGADVRYTNADILYQLGGPL